MSKPSIFSMSLLPVVLLVLLILGAGYFLMSGDVNISKIFSHEPEMRRLNGFPTVLDSTVAIDKQRVVIHNDQELAQFFNTVDSTAKLTLADKIDYNKEFLIGVSSKALTDKRSTLKVKKLYLNNQEKSIVVSVAQTDLGDKCEVEKGANVAIDLVAVSKTDWKITFETTKSTKQCTTP